MPRTSFAFASAPASSNVFTNPGEVHQPCGLACEGKGVDNRQSSLHRTTHLPVILCTCCVLAFLVPTAKSFGMWCARVDSNHRPFAPEAKSRCQRANSLTSRDLGRRVWRGTLGRSGSLSALLSAHSSAHGSPLALNLMSVCPFGAGPCD